MRRAALGSLSALVLGWAAKPAASAAQPSSSGASIEATERGTAVFGGAVAASPADPRDFRALRLANGLEVLLVFDPLADGAAAALDVHVGHYSDPPAFPGLAHFCEHMLFLGTEVINYVQWIAA